MSTYFRPLDDIPFAALFDGRLESYGVRERASDDTTDSRRCLTDGQNWLWCTADDNGQVDSLIVYAQLRNWPIMIFEAISKEFDSEIVSDHDARFWGFETQEEWDEYQKEMARRDRDEFYADLIKYVRGEPNDIRPGTIGEKQAQIAKELITDSPALGHNDRKLELLEAVDRLYDERHAVIVKLTPEDMDLVRFMSPHEGKLPEC